MSMPEIRVLCVDDHRLMREGIVHIVGLQPDIKVVAEASNGEEAVEQFLRHRPDVTLMDLQLPRMNGLQAIRAIRHDEPNARVVVLTMYHGDEDIYRALQAGAAGYLLKDTVPEDLVGVIREVHAGQAGDSAGRRGDAGARATQPALTLASSRCSSRWRPASATRKSPPTSGSAATRRARTSRAFSSSSTCTTAPRALAEALRRGLIHFG